MADSVTAPSTPPFDFASLEGLGRYAAYHEGQIQQRWTDQFALNSDITKRVRSVERRLWMISGATAAAAFAGTFLGQYVS